MLTPFLRYMMNLKAYIVIRNMSATLRKEKIGEKYDSTPSAEKTIWNGSRMISGADNNEIMIAPKFMTIAKSAVVVHTTRFRPPTV